MFNDFCDIVSGLHGREHSTISQHHRLVGALLLVAFGLVFVSAAHAGHQRPNVPIVANPIFHDGFDRAGGDFTLTVGPGQKTVQQGGSTVFQTLFEPHAWITNPALLEVTGAAIGTGSHKISYDFEGNPFGGFTLNLDVGSGVSPGTHTLVVHATVGGAEKTQTVTVHVVKPANPGFGIVYARVPRSYKPIRILPEQSSSLAGDLLNMAYRDKLPEVSHILNNFNGPGQLVWRHANGTETVIFDCVNGMHIDRGDGFKLDVTPPQQNGDDVCVPADPMVSFDGSKVAFAVYHATANKQLSHYISYTNLESWRLSSPTWAGIYIYDLNSGKLVKTAWPHEVSGQWDTAPVWLPDGKMMFTSTRGVIWADSTRAPSFGRYSHGTRLTPKLQLWLADDWRGNQARNVGTEAQNNVLHPFVHSSGRVFFSIHEAPFFRWKGIDSGQGGETFDNLWWVDSVDLRGGNLVGHLSTHAFGFLLPSQHGGTFSMTLKANHFFTELSNGDFCTESYYRGNNLGAGDVLCWPTHDTSGTGDFLAPLGHEGRSPLGLPEGTYIGIAGGSNDGPGYKVRDPAGLPNMQVLFAGSIEPRQNACSTNTYTSTQAGWTEKYLLDDPSGRTCDMGIYMKDALTPGFDGNADTPHYAQAIRLVNDPHWQEFMPKPILSYQAIYGMSQPRQPALSNVTGCPDDAADGCGNSYGVFGAVDAYRGNLAVDGGWQGPHGARPCHFQGCALQAPSILTADAGPHYDEFNHNELKYIRFWKVVPNASEVRPSNNPIANIWGEDVILMGDVPVEPDGSFKAKLPANVPFLMAGVDAKGRVLARHQHVMAMKPGEKQVCAGCHLHATTEAENTGGYASLLDRYQDTDAGKLSYAAIVPTMRWASEKPQPQWREDIYPMLQANCSSCHDGSHGSPAPNFAADEYDLYVTLTAYWAEQGHFKLGKPKTESGVAAAEPWVTRYINAAFSRESLLYWKAAGKRVDGRTDTTRNDDFNFGPAHGKYLSDDQLRELSDWIEQGLSCEVSEHDWCGRANL